MLSGGCASVGITSALSGIANMGLINAAATANKPIYAPPSDYKALVCILLGGGNDSFNMLIPRGNDEYNQYQEIRTNLAIPQNNLLPINPDNNMDIQLGLHPNLSNIKQLFDNQNLAFVANVGALVAPTSKSAFDNQSVKVPVGLFSHSDQVQHWQTCVPQSRSQLTGWGGRLADILFTTNENEDISMNISLDEGNLFQKGRDVLPYVIRSNSSGGSVAINGSTSNGFYQQLKRQTLDNLLDATYQNAFHKAYAGSVKSAIGNSFEFSSALGQVDDFNTTFADDTLSRRLRMTARTIAASDALRVRRQTFFVRFGGFDNHDDINEHTTRMATLNDALGSFYSALEEIGVADQVTTFTISDFGRKLVSNGSGSDHAWGGQCHCDGWCRQWQTYLWRIPRIIR